MPGKYTLIKSEEIPNHGGVKGDKKRFRKKKKQLRKQIKKKI